MTTDLTTEESEALEAMKQDTGEGIEQEQVAQQEQQQEQEAPEGETPETDEKAEFKSSRSEKPPEGYVPHQAMHAERTRRQDAERQLAEMTARIEALEKPADQPPQWVDPLEDPEAHRKWAEYQNSQTRNEFEKFKEQQESQAKAQQRQMDAARQENEFRAANPDYDAALQHMYDTRVSELRAQGYGEAEINQTISQQVNALYDAAQSAGINFGEMLYLRAQKTGYQKAQDAGQKITQLAEAQQKTQGLGSAGGGKQQGSLTLDQIASMSQAEYEKNMNERPAEMRRAMGG